jgi:hypothetical protein
MDGLVGYTTRPDNRLALFFFVRNKNMQPVVDTTRNRVAARPEFGRLAGRRDRQASFAAPRAGRTRHAKRVRIGDARLVGGGGSGKAGGKRVGELVSLSVRRSASRRSRRWGWP